MKFEKVKFMQAINTPTKSGLTWIHVGKGVEHYDCTVELQGSVLVITDVKGQIIVPMSNVLYAQVLDEKPAVKAKV